MKDCKKIHPLLSPYAGGELSAAEKTKVDKHLNLCLDAQKELKQLEDLLSALHRMPSPPVPKDLHDKIMARLGGKVVKLPARHGFWGLPAWALSAAAVVLFLLLNQTPHWQDTLKVQKHETEGAVPESAKNESIPLTQAKAHHQPSTRLYSTTFKKTAKVDAAAPLEDMNQAYSTAAGNDLGLKKNEQQKDFNLSVNAPSAVNVVNGSTEGGPKAAVPMAAMEPKESRTRDKMAVAELSSEPAPQPAPMAAAPALDQSMRSLTYSREESVTTWKGDQGNDEGESQELITDEEAFQTYWTQAQPGAALPAVDFTKEAVVALKAGPKPTAGYSIYVSRLEEKTDQLVIHYRVDGPAPDAVTAQILTHPWALQVIPKPDKPVVFQKDN